MRPRRAGPERDVYGRADVALVTAAEAAALDRSARERHGVPERVLMETAGRAAALVIERLFPRGRVLVLAGSGNNGGDGLVVARVLRAWGRDAGVVAAGSRPPDAALLHGFDVPLGPTDRPEALLAGADVLVDALLGTGTEGPPRAGVAEWIRRIGASGRPVVALDLPSGVNATTGRIEGDAIAADVTVTFGWPKLGLLLNPARARCGRIVAVEMGFPPLENESGTSGALITPAWAAARLPPRRPDAHKSTAGRLAILAGREGMAGAAALAAEGARRAGAGLIRIVSAGGNRVILQSLVPEATFVDRDVLERSDLDSVHALVAGPGIGTDEDARRALDETLERTGDRPVLLDADALNLHADDADALRQIAEKRRVVVTPHPLELARITGRDAREIQDDRPAAVRDAASRFGCVVLLKGQPSLVAGPDGRLLVNSAGSSDLAAAGMGDQLAGVVGAMLAAGAEPIDAAGAGLFFSARAADLAARGRSLGPRDVSDHLDAAFRDPGPHSSRLGLPFVTFDQPPRW